MTGILNALIAGVSGAVKDAYFNLVSLLLPGNGTNGAQNNTFLDGSSNNFTITRNGNTTQGTFSPFSQTGWGNYFDGTGDYLTAADNAVFTLGTSDFTIEAWVYALSSGTTDRYFIAHADNASAAGSSFIFYIFSGNSKIYFDCFSSSTTTSITSDSAIVLNQWNHVAICRSSGTLAMFVNGTRQASPASIGSSSINNCANSLSIGARTTGGSTYTGYLSNARMVVGTDVYGAGNSTITVPTAPLTAITNTQLLTCQSNRFRDASANSFPLTVNGNPSVTPFSPFAPTQSYSAAAVGGSGYFDGTGDYLDGIGTAADWAFMSNSTALWSFECWLFVLSSAEQGIIDTCAGSSGNIGVYVSKTSSNTILVDITRGVTGTRVATGTTTGTLTPNAWNHLLVSYDQSLSTQNLKIYINGGSAETFNKTANAPSGSNPTYSLRVGGFNATATLTWNGYISSLRISNVARSSSVPTTPYSSDANTKLLLNFTNAGVVDATAKNVLETVGNAQIVSPTPSKWGGGSMYFDGTGDYLLMPVNDLTNFGNGAFTVEGWVRINVTGSFQAIYSRTLASTSGYGGTWVRVTDTNVLQAAFSSGTSAHDLIISGTTALTTGQWYHFAWVRSSNTFYLYLNGSQEATTTSSVTMYASGDRVSVGTQFNSSSAANTLNGYVDDLRVTKGLARYTGSTYTVPTAPFPVQ